MGRRPKETKPSHVGNTERRREAVEYRIAGMTFEEIGKRMGITAQGAHALVVRAMNAHNAVTAELVNEHRALDISRMEEIVRILWPRVQEGHLDSVDRVFKAAQRKAALLGMDLKQPEQHLHVHAGEVTPVAQDASRDLMDQFRAWATGQAPAALPSPAPDVIEGEAEDGPVA